MLIVMKSGASASEIERVLEAIDALGFRGHSLPGANRNAIGVTGNSAAIDPAHFANLAGVAQAIRVDDNPVGPDGRFLGSNLDPDGSKSGHVDLSEREHVRVQHLHGGPALGDRLVLGLVDRPEGAGAELAQAIRYEAAWQSLPIVFLSAEGDLNLQMKAMGSVADGSLGLNMAASLETPA